MKESIQKEIEGSLKGRKLINKISNYSTLLKKFWEILRNELGHEFKREVPALPY